MPLTQLVVGLALGSAHLWAGEAVRVEPQGDVKRANFVFAAPSSGNPEAVLVLCPGQNGLGEEFLADSRWQAFANDHQLAIVVPQFGSDDTDLRQGRGYFVAAQGSGEMLTRALSRNGWGELPILLYGFSGGAHFAMSFAAWAPERVLGFCAYSFAWWTPPPDDLRCPAIIACGQFDGARYGSSFAYFQAGRRQGKPWAWVSLEDQGHSRDLALEEFVMAYFSALLRVASSKKDTGE